MRYEENKSGYIVYEDNGGCPLAYGGCEKWYATYSEAINEALKIVRQMCNKYRDCIDLYSVIVYEGSEDLLHQFHTCPGDGRVVFHWENYWRMSYGNM